MNIQAVKHVRLLLVLIFGVDFIFRIFHLSPSLITFLLIPLIYTIIYLNKSVIYFSMLQYIDGILMILCICLVLIIPLKIYFTYFNIYLSIVLISLCIYFYKAFSLKFESDKWKTTLVLLITFDLILIIIPNNSILAYLNLKYNRWSPNLQK
ncbi:hypothetical protein AHMF7605_21110 [Adhaeribacter arboris]|uniref:Uncharacterized protein n=1 Tax=Adhaeribacter arboris TaxID=2072846 RepID=A0A2T2YJZ1_9BACT|nr:hypothetical protein AHMF7605_21110 [Adhaeribacter arboris]